MDEDGTDHAAAPAAGYFVTLLSALLPFWTKLDATEDALYSQQLSW